VGIKSGKYLALLLELSVILTGLNCSFSASSKVNPVRAMPREKNFVMDVPRTPGKGTFIPAIFCRIGENSNPVTWGREPVASSKKSKLSSRSPSSLLL